MIDIYSLNYDGNLLDAAGIAAVAALKNAKIPKYDEEAGKVLYGEHSKENIPLAKEIPISLTVHKIGDNLIVDPTAEEEEISEARVTIASSDGTIYSVQKGELKELEIEEFYKILDLIEKTDSKISSIIKEQLKWHFPLS